jgi:hypothetical protein
MATVQNSSNNANDLLAGGFIGRFLSRLTTNHLLLGVVALFMFDLVLPDPLPFIDEIFLATIAILVARWQSRKDEAPAPAPAYPAESTGVVREVKTVTPPKA